MNTLSKVQKFKDFKNTRICIVGLGYVGLPLALSFSKFFLVTGYDKDEDRIKELKNGLDKNSEVKIKKNKNLYFTSNICDLKDCNCYILALPTPVNQRNKPDLSILAEGSKTISKFLFCWKNDHLEFLVVLN